MFSPQALIKGLISRTLPTPTADGAESEGAARFSRYRETAVLSYVRKSHLLADEGAYFTTNNAQTGIATNTGVAFAATSPYILIQNTDVSAGKRIYLDYIHLVDSIAGTLTGTGAYTAYAIVLDSVLRYSSAGTNLTPQNVSPNTDINTFVSVASVYCGAIVATAASAKARTVVGQRNARFVVSATVPMIIGDSLQLNFGGVEAAGYGLQGSSGALMANGVLLAHEIMPIVIGPQQSALVYFWQQAATTVSAAPAFIPEIAWWER